MPFNFHDIVRVSETVLTTGTAQTYTVPAGVTAIIVEMLGGGGGGGGADSDGSTTAGCGAGGSSGAYARKAYNVTPNQQFVYTVGALGAGGTAGNNAGTAGGSTLWDESGSVVTAPGGNGGGSVAGGTTVVRTAAVAATTSTGGDVNGVSIIAERGFRVSADAAYGTNGASSYLGRGGIGQQAATGGAASGYGSGGGGTSRVKGTDLAGGDGSAGIIIVTELKSSIV